jgi:hypothetical protein
MQSRLSRLASRVSPLASLIRPSGTFSPKGALRLALPVGEKEPGHFQSFKCTGTEFSREIVSLHMTTERATPRTTVLGLSLQRCFLVGTTFD